MASETKTATAMDDLDDLAFQLFTARAAAHPGQRTGERDAIQAYREAEAFLAVRKKLKAGELKATVPEGPQLADCSAPNQKRTHPHNLVSQRFGDLAKVNRIKQWLDRNPTPENEPEQLLQKLSHEFPDLGWDMPTVNVARAIFPAYAAKN